MAARTIVGSKIESQKTLWILHRGRGKAALVKPMSLQQTFDLGGDVDLVERAPVENVLEAVRFFLTSHADWFAIWSIPTALPDAQQAECRAREIGARRLQDAEQADILDLGMDVPLGEWVDSRRSVQYLMEG